MARELLAGAVTLAHTPVAARSLVVVLVNRIMFGALTLVLLLVLRNRIHDPSDPDAALSDFALVAGAVTIGAFAAAFLTPVLGRRLGPIRWVSLAGVLAGLFVTPTLFTLAVWPIVATAPFVGLSNQSAKITSDTMIQRTIPDDQLGRVFSIVDVTVNVGLVIGVFAVAMTAPADGVSTPGFLAVGATYLLTAAWYYAGRHRYPASASPRPDAAPH